MLDKMYMKPTKIAVLLPSSTTHKQLGYDFYLAMQYAMEHKQIAVEWMSASIGFGVDEVDMLSKAEDLLLNRGADMLVAFAEYPKISHLFPLLEALNKELLMVNMGAKLPPDWNVHPLVFHFNLQESLLAFRSGKELIARGVQKAALAANYYEGGYSPCQQIIDSFVESGGDITYNFIPQSKGQFFSIAPLEAYLEQEESNVTVLANYSNPLARVFLDQWASKPVGKKHSLWASSACLMDALDVCPEHLSSSADVTGLLAWYKELDTEENRTFVTVYEGKLKRAASYVAALGWDTGLLLAAAMTNSTSDRNAALSGLLEDGLSDILCTRGKVLTDIAYHSFIAPAFRFSSTGGQFHFELIPAESLRSEWQDLKDKTPHPNQNGWFNTYLCS